MTDTPTNDDTPKKEGIKETLGAWGSAGSKLGSLAGEVGKRVRDDLTDKDDDAVGKLRADASEAKDAFKKADSRGDYLEAGKDFAKDAGGFLRNVVDSVKDAVSEAKDSETAKETKSAFSSAVESSRDRVDDATDNIRARREARADKAGADDDSTDGEVLDIIEGEVVAEDPNKGQNP